MVPTHTLSLNKCNGSELSNVAAINLFRHSLQDTITLSKVVKYATTMTYMKLLKPPFLHLVLH